MVSEDGGIVVLYVFRLRSRGNHVAGEHRFLSHLNLKLLCLTRKISLNLLCLTRKKIIPRAVRNKVELYFKVYAS